MKYSVKENKPNIGNGCVFVEKYIYTLNYLLALMWQMVADFERL